MVPNLQKPSWKKYLQGTGCLAVHAFWLQCESKQVSCVWKCLQDERNLQWPDWWNLQTAWGSLSIFNLNLSLLTSLLWCRSVDGCACFWTLWCQDYFVRVDPLTILTRRGHISKVLLLPQWNDCCGDIISPLQREIHYLHYFNNQQLSTDRETCIVYIFFNMFNFV